MNILKYNKNKDENYHHAHWRFLHGKLENDHKYDLFGFDEEPPKEVGVFKCFYDGKKCILFQWTVELFPKVKGLCVYADDKKAILYAVNCYIDNMQII